MASRTKHSCQNKRKTMDDFPNLKKMLPPDCNYYFEDYQELEPLEGERRFSANFRISQNLATKESVRQWIDAYCSHSLTTFRIDRTYPKETTFYKYRVDLRCQHNTKPTSHKRVQTPHKKHTACPAKMIIKIRQARLSQRKRHEAQLKTHPIEVCLHHHHNHPILENSVLKYRDPDGTLTEKFQKMYRAGYKPAAALEIHKRDLHLEYEDSYSVVVEDRGLCPDLNWCYRQFNLLSKADVCTENSKWKMQTLYQYVCEYNKRYGDHCAALKMLNDLNCNVVIAVLSPLMKSAHCKLECSGKFMVIDSLEVDYLRCKVYLMVTHSGVGGLPLGVLITSSDSSSVFQEALSLYISLLDEQSFAGRGHAGPSSIFMEDNDVQHDIIRAIFPEASIFLSPYHIIQKIWGYLWEGQLDIRYNYQMKVFETFKCVMHSKSEVDFENSFRKLESILEAQPSPDLLAYLQSLYLIKDKWAICFREGLESFVEEKDIIHLCVDSLQERFLSRCKSCTTVELLKFLTNDMEEFFKQKLGEFVNSRYSDILALRYDKNKKVQDVLEVVPYFKVRNVSSGVMYDVDFSIGFCSCSTGVTGTPCQHQYALIQKLNVSSFLENHTVSERARADVINIVESVNSHCETSEIPMKTMNKTEAFASSVCEESDVQMCEMDFSGKSTAEEGGSYVGCTASGDTNSTAEHGLNDNLLTLGSSEALLSPVITQPNAQPLLSSLDSSNEFEASELEAPGGKEYTDATTNDALHCHICGKIMVSSTQLARHQKMHNHKKSFVCDLCGLGYNSRERLKNHHARNHLGKKTFDCNLCGKKFKRLGSVARHRKEHSDKDLICAYCNEVFSSNGDLTDHVNNVHGATLPNIIFEVKDQLQGPLELHRQDIKEIIIIDTEGQLPISGGNSW